MVIPMVFENILLIAAKIGFIIILVLFLFRWLFAIPYLWLRYDKKIVKLKLELDQFRKEQRQDASGRGITTPVLDRIIERKTEDTAEKLEILETRRHLFLDRVNLLLSIISVQK